MSSRWIAAVAIALVCSQPIARADDPSGLDDVVARVRDMKANAATNREMAEYVMGIVDRRIVNDNGFEGVFKRGFVVKDPYYQELYRDFEKTIRPQLSEQGAPGREYETFARWAWNNHYGQCAENSAIVYYIFKNAGVSVHMYERPGHAFAAIGLEPGYDPADLSTYGDQAYFVDPWFGVVVKAQTAGEFRHTGQGLTGLLTPFGPTKDKTRTQVTSPGYDNPKAYEMWINNAYLVVKVESSATGEPVHGARITIVGADGTVGTVPELLKPTRNVGYFKPGEYTVSVTSADGRFTAPAKLIKLALATRNELLFQLRDEGGVPPDAAPDAPAPDAPPPLTADDWVGLWRGRTTTKVRNNARPAVTGPTTAVITRRGDGLRIVSADKGEGKAMPLDVRFLGTDFRTVEGTGGGTDDEGTRVVYTTKVSLVDGTLTLTTHVHYTTSRAMIGDVDITGTLTRESANVRTGK